MYLDNWCLAHAILLLLVQGIHQRAEGLLAGQLSRNGLQRLLRQHAHLHRTRSRALDAASAEWMAQKWSACWSATHHMEFRSRRLAAKPLLLGVALHMTKTKLHPGNLHA